MKTAKAEGLNHWTTDQGPPQKYVNLFFFLLLYRSGRCGMPRPRETSSGRTSPTGQPGQHKIWSCSLKIPLTKRGQGLSRIKYKLTLGDREGWGWVGGSRVERFTTFFSIFENGYNAPDQVYFFKYNSKKAHFTSSATSEMLNNKSVLLNLG